MNTFISRLKTYFINFQILAYFAFGVAVAVYLFPTERKFKFEFQKGKPWMHKDLTAEFDFAIYKTESEISAEKDSAFKSFKPFFKIDETVSQEQLENLPGYEKNAWDGFLIHLNTKHSIATKDSRDLRRIEDSCKAITYRLLNHVYNQGIVELDENFTNARDRGNKILVFIQDAAVEVDPTSVYTQKSAYEFITKQIDAFCNKPRNQSLGLKEGYFDQLHLNEFILPNFIFDAITSMKMQKLLLNDISLTKGMVQKGEKIVSQGDVIDSEKFMILESLRKEFEERSGGDWSMRLILLGRVILMLCVFFIMYLYLKNYRPAILATPKHTLFIILISVLILFMQSTLAKLYPQSIYFIPVLLLPILLRTFFDGHVAIFFMVISMVTMGFYVPNPFEYIFLNLIAGVIGVIYLKTTNTRSKLVITALLIVLAYAVVYSGLNIIQEGNFKSIDWRNYMAFGLNGLLLFLANPLIYVFEKLFGFLSDATLLELSDTNQPLLREIAEKAPATFQHSLQVANLAESGTLAIGGNPLLARAGALYHDLGKMKESELFIENQTDNFNPHDKLEFDESARRIIDHVNRGVAIAKKHNLPEPIIDFIKMHHGTTTVQYFYKNYIAKYPEKISDVEKFRYPGPRPLSKETAVLMMADSIEAASRSLKYYNEQSIGELVDKIISYQFLEKQFDDANITLKEISSVKEVFKKKLRNIYHARISYPE